MTSQISEKLGPASNPDADVDQMSLMDLRQSVASPLFQPRLVTHHSAHFFEQDCAGFSQSHHAGPFFKAMPVKRSRKFMQD